MKYNELNENNLRIRTVEFVNGRKAKFGIKKVDRVKNEVILINNKELLKLREHKDAKLEKEIFSLDEIKTSFF